jgi:tryptophan-rich sensory protein
MTGRNGLVLAGFIALCLTVGALGGWITAPAVAEWYPTLNKPAWNPPDWLFAPVWTTLYVLMAVAAWLVWQRGQQGAAITGAMVLFFSQLMLNLAWSFLFFGARQPGTAFMEILMLWAALLATIVAFWRISRPAGLLLLPYIAWVSFAALLNYTVWQMNP